MSDQTSPETETLLPCPFCGTEAQLVCEADFVTVACPHYYCNFSQIALRNKEKAVARWNTRTPGLAQTPADEQPSYPDAPMVCAELYQVIGYMAFHYGIMEHPDVQKALDNASQHKLVHTDLLPWPKQDLPSPDTSTDRSATPPTGPAGPDREDSK